MKKFIKVTLLFFVFYSLPNQVWSSPSESATSSKDVGAIEKQDFKNDNPESAHLENDTSHNEWLKARFTQQHHALIPIVAVADMFLMCNQARKTDTVDYQLDFLINKMDKNKLAEKLGNCLGDDDIQSDVALNFGLQGCFNAQFSYLPKAERQEKMALVKQAIGSLSLKERKKSFTQCVTEQSIHYLK